jgi:hypothetical protein
METPLIAWIKVMASDSGVYPVWINGEERGTTTLDHSLRPGSYVVEVRIDLGAADCTATVSLDRDDEVCLSCEVAAGDLIPVQCPAG